MSSPFNKISLTEDELLRGSVLSNLQKYVIINRLAELAQEIVNLPVLEIDKQKYFDQLAFFKGQYAELNSMLEASDVAERQLNSTKE